MHLAAFLQFPLVLTHVIPDKREFRPLRVAFTDFWMGPLNHLFPCLFSPVHATKYVTHLSAASRTILASCLEPDIRAISAVDFGAQHLFTWLCTIPVCHWSPTLTVPLSKSQLFSAGLCRWYGLTRWFPVPRLVALLLPIFLTHFYVSFLIIIITISQITHLLCSCHIGCMVKANLAHGSAPCPATALTEKELIWPLVIQQMTLLGKYIYIYLMCYWHT